MTTKNEPGAVVGMPKEPHPEITPTQALKQPLEFNEQTNYVPVKTIITIFLACASVDLLALMDQTTLAASLTIVSRDLNASNESAWIAGAYFLTSTSFQLLYGRLSDIWSRKVLLIIGIGIFFFGSLAASLAQSALQLIVSRAFMGVGGGGLMTVAQMIVSDIVPLRERGKYQGILGSVVALANGVGPVIGGALASQSHDSWRWIFRLNLFLCVLTTGSVVFFMPLRKVDGDWKKKIAAIDFFGAFLALAGSALLVLALTWAGGQYAWSSAYVVATLVVGVAVSVSFIIWQWKCTKVPLIPMTIFTSRVVNGAGITMFVNGWNFLVQVYYIPSFYQLVYGYTAVKSGALLLPITLTQSLISTLDSLSLGKQIGYGLLAGLGLGNTLQPSLIAVQAGVERKHMAVVTSTRNFIRNLGGTLGLAISGTIINNAVRSSLIPYGLSKPEIRMLLDTPDMFRDSVGHERTDLIRAALASAYQQGFRVVFIVGAVLNALAFIAAWFLMPQVELSRKDDAQLKEEGKKRRDEKRGRTGPA
ncbi:unnamed protein product [Alternaria alternata]